MEARSRDMHITWKPRSSAIQPSASDQIAMGRAIIFQITQVMQLLAKACLCDNLISMNIVQNSHKGFDTAVGTVQMVSDAGAGDLHQLWNAVWDPHDHSRLLTAGGSNIQVSPPPPPPPPPYLVVYIEHAAICRMHVCVHMQAPQSAEVCAHLLLSNSFWNEVLEGCFSSSGQLSYNCIEPMGVSLSCESMCSLQALWRRCHLLQHF